MKALAAGILSFLGFSCNSLDPVCEYGTPNADFELKTKVIDGENKPIKGLEVEYWERPRQNFNNIKHTDANGEAIFRQNMLPPKGYQVVEVRDVDGEENGKWETKKDSVYVDSKNFKNKKDWYQGSGSASITIQMKKAEK